ncbi:unnamed protein product, partial [Timema podura]|nr:unnamed protein product [Timema podura]
MVATRIKAPVSSCLVCQSRGGCSPVKVNVPSDCVIRTVRCGGDATAVVTTDGALLMCGRNSGNKLGLAEKRGLLNINFKVDVEKVLTLTRVKGVGDKVADVSIGTNHTAVLTESGHVITFGRNTEGQLGRGHLRPTAGGPTIVKPMADKIASMVQCGPTYTVAGTIENAVYFWGTRYNNMSSQDLSKNSTIGFETSGAWSQSRSTNKFRDPTLHGSQAGAHYTNILNASRSQKNQQSEVILEPQEILALYASPSQIAKGETVSLAGLYPQRNTLLILVDTTAPLARIQPQSAAPSQTEGDSDSYSDEENMRGRGQGSTQQDVECDSIGP